MVAAPVAEREVLVEWSCDIESQALKSVRFQDHCDQEHSMTIQSILNLGTKHFQKPQEGKQVKQPHN